jgi:hypothetical protein
LIDGRFAQEYAAVRVLGLDRAALLAEAEPAQRTARICLGICSGAIDVRLL